MKYLYQCEATEQTAILTVPEGFDPPPVIQVPIASRYGSGVELFELHNS